MICDTKLNEKILKIVFKVKIGLTWMKICEKLVCFVFVFRISNFVTGSLFRQREKRTNTITAIYSF